MEHAILVITELFLPTKGGTAVWFDEVYRRMGGKEIHIVTSHVPECEVHDKGHPNTIHRVHLKRYSWIRPESLIMYLKLIFISMRVMLFNSVKEIHSGRVLPEGLVGLFVSRIAKKPFLVYAHGEEITTWMQFLKSTVMKFVYRNADIVIANSEFTRQELLNINISDNKIKVIHPGVDTNRFKKLPERSALRKKHKIPKENILLLSVGRLSRRKGFDMVVKSLPLLIKQNIEVSYVIIGVGEDEDYLKKLAHNYGVENRVHFIGNVSMDELPKWYNECDLFVMPNRKINGDVEGFGMVFIEAGACGKAAIAGCTGGTDDAVLDKQTGIRVDGNDINQIVNAIMTLVKDPEYRTKLEENAFNRVHSEFSWEKVAVKTRLLFNEWRSK